MRFYLLLALAAAALTGGVVAYRSLNAHSRTAAAMVHGGIASPWSVNERAVPVLQEKLKLDPDNADLNTALGNAYLQKARETGDPSFYPRVEKLFARALSRNPERASTLAGLASLAMSRHQFENAREFANRAIEIDPDLAEAHGMLADALIELGNYDAAVPVLQRMVNLKPNLSSYSRISYLRELMGDSTGAVSAMEMAVQAGGPAAENTAWCMVQLGLLYLNNGRAHDAEGAFKAALVRFPDYVHAYAGLGRVAVARKNLELAADFYRKAIARVPLAEFVTALGEIYERLEKNEQAQAQYALVEAMERVYNVNGVSTDVEMVLFRVDRGRDLEAAIERARRELERRPSIKAADALAWAFHGVGRYDEAQAAIEKALRLGTRDPLLLFHAGMIAHARGEKARAAQYLSRAVSLNPGFSALHAVRAEQLLK